MMKLCNKFTLQSVLHATYLENRQDFSPTDADWPVNTKQEF